MVDCQTTILVGDVLEKLTELPDESVHMVVTSPPYWGLRDYGGVEGQIGLEASPGEHIEVMVDVFREVRRVLRGDGTLWLNYGDCYATAANGRSAADTKAAGRDDRTFRDKPFSTVGDGLKPKDLCMIPARVALALQADGWWLRSEIVWAKPNPMPESIRDRPVSSHEKLYLLAKRARYFYDAVAVRTAAKSDKQRGLTPRHEGGINHTTLDDTGRDMGANLRNVWTIATKPFKEAHFATFPPALVEPCILAGTSAKGVCPQCGAPWVREMEREMEREFIGDRTKARGEHVPGGVNRRIAAGSGRHPPGNHRTTGWSPFCGCDAGDPMPATVLDPFGGAGTVGLVANRLGRAAVLIELNPDYATMARARIRNDLGVVESDMMDDDATDAGPLFSSAARTMKP